MPDQEEILRSLPVTLLGAFAPNVVTQNLTSIDLSLDKTVNNPTPNVGQQVTFTLTLANPAGGIDVAGIVVTDLLPSGLDFDSATTATGSYDENTGLWTVGTLAAGLAERSDLRLYALCRCIGFLWRTEWEFFSALNGHLHP